MNYNRIQTITSYPAPSTMSFETYKKIGAPSPSVIIPQISSSQGGRVNSVIADLEQRGEQVAKEVITDKNMRIETAQEKLLNVMSNGAKEFEQRTGRKMTYAEMRETWG